MVFVDTSAVLALLDGDDQFHSRADRAWAEILETCALLQRFDRTLENTRSNDAPRHAGRKPGGRAEALTLRGGGVFSFLFLPARRAINTPETPKAMRFSAERKLGGKAEALAPREADRFIPVLAHPGEGHGG